MEAPLPARDPTDRICMSFTLPSDDEARRFMRAAEDIEADLLGTVARIISFSDAFPGQIPPPGSTQTGGPWLLVGVVIGPRVEEIQDSDKAAIDTDWTKQIMEILKDYGLEAEQDTVQ